LSSIPGLQSLGIKNPTKVHRNLNWDQLAEHEAKNKEGVFVSNGKFTGRSPNDKWVVKHPSSEKNMDWGKVNKPIPSEVFDDLYKLCIEHYNKLDEVCIYYLLYFFLMHF
jgi:phosphoenolpyruvate carboxykinase (ATP)